MNQEISINKINLTISEEILNDQSGFELDTSLLNDVKIVGLMGYSGSGKDTIADYLVKHKSYKKIKFADIVKQYMNENLTDQIYEDLKSKGVQIERVKVDFTIEKDRKVKEVLRPYMVYFAELIREKNGPYYWINRTFKNNNISNDKIVIADIRRDKELDIFSQSASFLEKWKKSLHFSEMNDDKKQDEVFCTNLYHINQYGLDDNDMLTKNTILKAYSNWLVDDVINIDARIPYYNLSRTKYVNNMMKEFVEKHKL